MVEEDRVESNDERQRAILMSRFLDDFAQGKPDEVVAGWEQQGYLAEILPEIEALKGVQQRPDYHMEGDVWVHTLLVLGKLPPNASLDLKLAALLHDVGKPQTTIPAADFKKGLHSHDHQDVGAKIAGEILARIPAGIHHEIDEERIIWLIKYHLTGQGSGEEVLRESKIRRYFLRPDGWGNDLLSLIKADTLGREAINQKSKTATLDATIARIAELKARDAREPTPALPIPNGHRIMELLGMQPSPAVGQIRAVLERIYKQGGFTDSKGGERVVQKLRRCLPLGLCQWTIPDDELAEVEQSVLNASITREWRRKYGGRETIQVFCQKEKTGDGGIAPKEMEGQWRKFGLAKAHARLLEGYQARILFLGPPRSGKTSFVHSLAAYLEELCQDLPFRLKIDEADLDKCRRDLSRLQGRFSTDWRKLAWTTPLAQEASRDFEFGRGNIVLGDGPGGDPDRITEIIAQSANCAIIIASGETDVIYKLRSDMSRQFLSATTTPVIGSFRSRPRGQFRNSNGEEIASELRVFKPGRFIGGQVVGLEFGQRNEDPVIKDVAKALLFSILPKIAQRSVKLVANTV